MNKYEKARENFLKKIGIATDEYMNEIEKLKEVVEE
jgi:predicted metal-binding transcription factor (methanogenesis marker protein 9)